MQTKMNPADDASRGISVEDLTDKSRWINGPSFLWQSKETWQVNSTENLKIEDDDVELKKIVQSHSVIVKESCGICELIFSKFSSWTKLKKAVSWMLRFKHWLIMKSKLPASTLSSVSKGKLKVEEVKKAEHVIISCIQIQCFKDEINSLTSKRKNVK